MATLIEMMKGMETDILKGAEEVVGGVLRDPTHAVEQSFVDTRGRSNDIVRNQVPDVCRITRDLSHIVRKVANNSIKNSCGALETRAALREKS